MAGPTLAGSALTATTATAGTLTTGSFTPATGEILVCVVVTEDSANLTYNAPTTSGSTAAWTQQAQSAVASNCWITLWTAKVTAGGVASTVSSTLNTSAGGAQHANLCVTRWTGAQLAATPATVSSTGSGAPSTSITTAAANSVVVWGDGDWAAVTGTATYSSGATQDQINQVSGVYSGYVAHQTAATAGSQTVGMTAPTGQTWSIVGVEVQAAASGSTYNAIGQDLSFFDNFETGNTSRWDTINSPSGTGNLIAVDSADAQAGSYGLHITESATSSGGVNIRKNIPASDHVMAESEMRINADPGSGNNSSGLRFFNASHRIADCYAQGTGSGGPYQLWVRYWNTSNAYAFVQIGTVTVAQGTWFKIRMEVIYNSGGSTINVWVNGTQQLNATGLALNSGQLTIFQHGHDTPSTFTDTSWDNTSIWVWQAPSDLEKITDSVTATLIHGASPSDQEKLTDSLSVTQSRVRTQSDPERLTDAIALYRGKSQTDPEKLTDAIALYRGKSQSDAEKMTDAITLSRTTSQTDSEKLTDSATAIQSLVRPISDSERLTDSATATLTHGGTSTTETPSDAEKLTDSVSVTQSLIRTRSDTEKLTDTATVTQSLVRAPSDAERLTDAVSATQSLVRTQSDPEKLTDAVTAVQSLVRASSDVEKLTDALSLTRATSQSDAEKLTDALSITKQAVRPQADLLKMTDAVSITQNGGSSTTETPIELLKMTDSVSVIQIRVIAVNDSLKLTDSTGLVRGLVLNDSLRLTDSAPLTRGLSLGDSLRMTDTSTKSVGIGVLDRESITDSVFEVQSRILTIADVLALRDALSAQGVQPTAHHDAVKGGVAAPDRWSGVAGTDRWSGSPEPNRWSGGSS